MPRKKSPAELDREIAESLAKKGQLPYGWADWANAERRMQVNYGGHGRRGGFVKWAEPPPKNPRESRYAVVIEGNLVRWARVSPNPDMPIDVSGGAFYEDMPGGATEAAARAAKLHKKKSMALAYE